MTNLENKTCVSEVKQIAENFFSQHANVTRH